MEGKDETLFTFNDGRQVTTSYLIKLLLVQYCHSQGLASTIKALERETGITFNLERGQKFRSMVKERQFDRAADYVKSVMQEMSSPDPSLVQDAEVTSYERDGFRDLLYVLSKYAYIDAIEKRNYALANRTFQRSLSAHANEERQRGDSRADWFASGTLSLRRPY